MPAIPLDRRTLLAALAGAFTTAAARAQGPASDRWADYVNARFGTALAYPANRFRPDPPPDNGDGQTFRAQDGAVLLVFGQHNALDETVASLEAGKTDDDYAEITYRARGPKWLVLSGFRDIEGVRSIFYEKYLFSPSGGVIHTMILTYPEARKDRYAPVIGRMAASLRGGD